MIWLSQKILTNGSPAYMRSACFASALVDPVDQFHADRLLFVVEKKVLGTAHVFQCFNSTKIITRVVYRRINDMCVATPTTPLRL